MSAEERTEEPPLDDPLTESEEETEPLTSSVNERVLPLEPRSEQRTPFQTFVQAILEGQKPRTKSDVEMAPPTDNTETKEVKLNLPKTFNGNRDKFRKFLQNVELHLAINKKIYDDDLKKIGFTLSFMTEGQAEAWADQFVEQCQAKNPDADLDLGEWSNFREELVQTFSAYDTPGDALNEMKNLRMKNEDEIDGHITHFATLLAESKLDKKSAVITDLFRETLPVRLQSRIMNLETPPTDLEGWYRKAKQIDNTAKRTRAILGKSTQNLKKNVITGNPKFHFIRRERDPNAMDVDALSLEERGKLMKEGKCFKCRKLGHLAKDCPSNPNKKKEEEPKKWQGKKLYSHIRNIYQDMDEDEKEEFLKEAQEAGF